MNDHPTNAAELSYARVFEAPRELVFRCMIEPEHLARFWGPAGTHTPLENIKVDARPGGVFETVMVNDHDGSQYAMRAVFVEVVPPERLVWTDSDTGVTTTSTFLEIHIRQANVPDAFRSPEARAGFSTSLDRLAGYVAALAGDPGR